MKRARISTGSMVITGTLILPESHLLTMMVISSPSMAFCSSAGVSSALHSTTFSQPQALATAAREARTEEVAEHSDAARQLMTGSPPAWAEHRLRQCAPELLEETA